MSVELVKSVQEMLKEETWTRAAISNYTKNNLIELAEIAAECAVKLAKNEEIKESRFRSSFIDNGFARIPTIWLEPTHVDKYNIDKVIIESGFHSATSVYKN